MLLKDYIFEDDLEDIRNALALPHITKKRGFSSQYREPIHPTLDTDDDDSSISSDYSITAMSGARSASPCVGMAAKLPTNWPLNSRLVVMHQVEGLPRRHASV